MNLAVVLGSPRGAHSVTLQWVRYLERRYPEHRFTRHDVGKGGRCIVIKRGKELFYIAHMDTVAKNLKKNDPITAGTPIGTLGNSGSARGTAPHVHFSTYVRNYYNSTDPFPYLMEALKNR